MRTRQSGKAAWKIVGISAGVLSVGAAVAVVGFSQAYEPVAWPGTAFEGTIDLSGLTAKEAEEKLDDWWASKQNDVLQFDQARFQQPFEPVTYADAGIEWDKEATLAQVDYDEFWDDLKSAFGQTREEREVLVTPVFRVNENLADELEDFVEEFQPPIQGASADYVDGQVVLNYGSAGMSFDRSGLSDALLTAVTEGTVVEIPVEEAEKRVPDAELERIQAVVSDFSTKFNSRQRSRSANIKLAAEKIDGLILMPGESFSFNDHLGKRTREKGYRAAGVYVAGRHDIDVGGGICQVSTTLYNAVLKGEMQVDTRWPHSLPVPYVPLGQDAAVSFPNPDLEFTNSFDFPIAIDAVYTPGELFFRILGERPNSREVKFETKYLSSWSHGEKLVHDGSLAPGERKVIDKGGIGRKVQTWKVIYENGEEVERIDLGQSSYRGGPKIIAVNQELDPPEGLTIPVANTDEE